MAWKLPGLKLTIRNKLLLLLAIPIFGLVVFATDDAYNKSKSFNNMKKLDVLVELSTKMGSLAHEMQKERGMTAAFLGSQGVQFSKELPSQRAETDKKRTEMEAILNTTNLNQYDANVLNSVNELKKDLSKLASIRGSVSAQKISSSEVVAYYTNTIKHLISIPHHTPTLSDNHNVSKHALTYLSLIQMKERAAQERATLSLALTSHGFSPKLIGQYHSIDAEEKLFEKEFGFNATEVQKEYYSKIHSGTSVAEVSRIKSVAYAASLQNKPIEIKAEHWFSVATNRINLLKQIEDKIATDLISEAHKVAASTSRQFYFTVFLAITTTVLSLIFSYFTIRGIARSTRLLTDTVSRVTEGDYSARSNVSSGDELGLLSNAFDNMLEERLSGIAQKQKESEALNNSIIEILRTVSRLGEGDLTVEVPVNEDITGALADAINRMSYNMSTTLTQVELASEYVRSTSKEAISIAEKSKSSVIDTSRGMGDIRNTIQETAKRIKRLGERSQEIGGIVKLIDDISERTNVLALNANMQAAQAGEAGRGFMVVADEVQRLAESSKQATEQISKLINNIQIETGDTISTMDKVIEEVVEGGQLADVAAEQTDSTEQVVFKLDDLGAQLATAVSVFSVTDEIRAQVKKSQENHTESQLKAVG